MWPTRQRRPSADRSRQGRVPDRDPLPRRSPIPANFDADIVGTTSGRLRRPSAMPDARAAPPEGRIATRQFEIRQNARKWLPVETPERRGITRATRVEMQSTGKEQNEAGPEQSTPGGSRTHPVNRAKKLAGADSVRRRLSASSSGQAAECRPASSTAGHRPPTNDPGKQLPVAARPSVLAESGNVVTRRKIVKDLNVRD